MESAETNKVSSEEALERARTWKEKGATLLLSISSGPGKRAVCENLAGRLTYIDDNGGSLGFYALIIEPEPQSSDATFVDGEVRFGIRLEGASFFMPDTPQKSMTISRGPYRCVLTEFRASAFG